jgi:hypothetical protein
MHNQQRAIHPFIKKKKKTKQTKKEKKKKKKGTREVNERREEGVYKICGYLLLSNIMSWLHKWPIHLADL